MFRRLDHPRAERILIRAPTGRDADAVQAVLGEAGMISVRCDDTDALCRSIEEGAGAVLVAEEALSPAVVTALRAALGKQAPWSDLPIVLVTGTGEHHEARLRTLKLLEPAGNITILERPFRKLTLMTVFETALRARRRQYQMRDAMAELLRAEQERTQAKALQQSEARYRALARNYPNGIVVVADRDLRCTLAEGQGLAAVGISREAIEGRPVGEVFPCESGLRCALDGQASTVESSFGDRINLVHYVPLFNAGGEVEAAMMVTHDITDQKRAEEALRNDAVFRERFVGVLAHDLRTPLQAIAFTAHMLASAALSPEKVRESAERVGRAAERMGRMISDLLDLTQSRQGGGIPIQPKAADMALIAQSAVDETQAANSQRRVVFTCQGDARGVWDADRLAQVASNLLSNAVAYSPPETPVLVDLNAAGDQVVLSVNNQGEPIPSDAIKTLFDPFKRGPGFRTQARRGLGLGLFIADRIVQAHGGTIRVESTARDGTTFTVILPRKPVSAHAPSAGLAVALSSEPQRQPSVGHECCDDGAPNGRRVLVVEDDADIRETVCDLLEQEGYRVARATNGREALEALAKGPRPCVMLLDMMMPVMDGWQVLEALSRDGDLAEIPVVTLSAAGPSMLSSHPGIRHRLSKPLHLRTLLATVQENCT